MEILKVFHILNIDCLSNAKYMVFTFQYLVFWDRIHTFIHFPHYNFSIDSAIPNLAIQLFLFNIA